MISAVVTAIAWGSTYVSTARRRLMPDIFLPASYPFCPARSIFFTLCASTITNVVFSFRPQLIRTAPTPFFYACSSRLNASSVRHWQPLFDTTEPCKKHHINQQLLVCSSSWLALIQLGWTLTALGFYHLGRCFSSPFLRVRISLSLRSQTGSENSR